MMKQHDVHVTVDRVRRWKVTQGGRTVWLAGMNVMQPLTRLAGVKAIQAVITSGLSRPQ